MSDMKKTFVIGICALLCLCGGKTMAQKGKAFTGSVKFEIKYEGDFEPQQLANAPRENEQLVSGNFTKTTHNLGGAFMHQIDMLDSIVRLWDLPGEKCAVTIPTPKKENEEQKRNYVIKKRTDTKEICGYQCQGYDIIVTVTKDDEEDEDEAEERTVTILVYTTEEIGIDSNINSHFIPGLQGFPLYKEQPAGEGKKIVYQAIEVKKKKINAIEFSIPSNYKYYTPKEWNEHIRELTGKSGEDEEDEEDDF
jgi:hypothetical protein